MVHPCGLQPSISHPNIPLFLTPHPYFPDWLASTLWVIRVVLVHNATLGLSHHVMDIFTWPSPLSQPNRFPALFSMPSPVYSCLLPFRPQAVSALSLPFSEGHSLILVSINADPVTHWPESFSSDLGTQRPSFRDGCVLEGPTGQGQGFEGGVTHASKQCKETPTAHHFHIHSTASTLGIDCLCSTSPSQSMSCI